MWWVQPFRKNCMLSFKTAKMTFNSRKSTFLCVFIATHHSFCFPNVFWRGVSRPQRPPPGSAPATSMQIYSQCTYKVYSSSNSFSMSIEAELGLPVVIILFQIGVGTLKHAFCRRKNLVKAKFSLIYFISST